MIGRARLHPRGAHVHQQERDALLRPAFGAGTHQAEDPVGILAERVPGLLAVDHVVLALANGAGTQRCQVGACAGLRIALTPPVFPGDDLRQEVRLLRGRGEGHQDRRHHAQRERQLHGSPGRGALLVEDVLLDHAPAGAAEALRPHASTPPNPVEDLLPADQVLLAQAPAQQHVLTHLRGQLGGEKRPHLGAEDHLLLGEAQVHALAAMAHRSFIRRSRTDRQPPGHRRCTS